MSSSDSSFGSSFFLVSAAGAAPPAAGAAAAAAGAGPDPAPEETEVMRFFTSTPSRALAKSPGQYGSNSTLAALRRVAIFSPVMATSSS